MAIRGTAFFDNSMLTLFSDSGDSVCKTRLINNTKAIMKEEGCVSVPTR